jgi:serine/threonine protein kinase
VTDREKVWQLAYDFLARRFAGELLDPDAFAETSGNPVGLLTMLREAALTHRAYLKRLISNYELLGLIGRGGYGEVYYAQHNALGHDCALKLVSISHASELAGIRKFKQEITDHTHLVPIEEFGRAGNRFFWYTMPLARNLAALGSYRPETVAARLAHARKRNKALPQGEVIKIGIEVATGLQHLHEKGLAHCDVKPANTLCFQVDEKNVKWKLGDVGLLTRPGPDALRGGTHPYWPPEGVQGDLRNADLYALGVTLFEALTARDAGRSRIDLVSPQAPDQRIHGIWAVLHQACARSPDDRFKTAEEFLQKLQDVRTQLATHEPAPAPRRRSIWKFFLRRGE